MLIDTDMFYSIRKLTLYMHKSITECYNMINSKTTLGIMAIFAASMLVTGALYHLACVFKPPLTDSFSYQD